MKKTLNRCSLLNSRWFPFVKVVFVLFASKKKMKKTKNSPKHEKRWLNWGLLFMQQAFQQADCEALRLIQIENICFSHFQPSSFSCSLISLAFAVCYYSFLFSLFWFAFTYISVSYTAINSILFNSAFQIMKFLRIKKHTGCCNWEVVELHEGKERKRSWNLLILLRLQVWLKKYRLTGLRLINFPLFSTFHNISACLAEKKIESHSSFNENNAMKAGETMSRRLLSFTSLPFLVEFASW